MQHPGQFWAECKTVKRDRFGHIIRNAKGEKQYKRHGALFDSITKARQWINSLQAKDILQLTPSADQLTLGELWRALRPDLEQAGILESMRAHIRSALAYFENWSSEEDPGPHVEPMPVADIRRPQLKAYHRHLQQQPQQRGDGSKLLSPTTIDRYLQTLRGLLNRCEEDELIAGYRPPTFRKLFANEKKRRPLNIDLEDFWRVVQQMKLKHAVLFGLMLNTGLRWSDVRLLTKDRFRLEKGKLILLASQRKTNLENQEIAILSPVQQLLEAYQGSPEGQANTTPYLVVNPHTKRPFRDLKRPLAEAREAAQSPHFTHHTIKHLAVTMLWYITEDLDLVAAMTRTSRQALERFYAHLLDKRKRKAYADFDAEVSRAAKAAGGFMPLSGNVVSIEALRSPK